LQKCEIKPSVKRTQGGNTTNSRETGELCRAKKPESAEAQEVREKQRRKKSWQEESKTTTGAKSKIV
jgi:hypothetical protein